MHKRENQGTPQPDTMRFAPTNRNRRRFLHDVPTVSYHPSSGHPGCPHAGLPRHKRGGQPNHSRADRAVCERLDPPGWAPDLKTRVALFLPARAHDALNRLLRVVPLSTRALMGLLIALSKRRYAEGYLCLDDCVIEKAFAKKLSWAGWTYSFAKKRKLYGLHVVVLLWCASEEGLRIPVAFRLWRPKRSCARRAYKTKLELCEEMLKEVVGSELATSSSTPITAPGGLQGWSQGWVWCGSKRSIRERSFSGAPSGARWASWPRYCL
jgi:hypothetical protein